MATLAFVLEAPLEHVFHSLKGMVSCTCPHDRTGAVEG